jgi:hypothetical protein
MGFVGIVVTLHLLQPDYDARDQLMSELALGIYGGAMLPAFVCLAASVFGIQGALGVFDGTITLRAVLFAASLCFLAAGIFPLGRTSDLHIVFIASAFILSGLAMYLFPSMAGRAVGQLPKAFSWTLAGGMAASIAVGQFIPIGIAQRLAATCLLLWIGGVGWRLARS